MPSFQESGCLENQAKPGCCLEVNINTLGSPVYMEPANGQVKQMWTAEIASGEITSGIGRMKSGLTTSTNQPLSLDNSLGRYRPHNWSYFGKCTGQGLYLVTDMEIHHEMKIIAQFCLHTLWLVLETKIYQLINEKVELIDNAVFFPRGKINRQRNYNM